MTLNQLVIFFYRYPVTGTDNYHQLTKSITKVAPTS